MITSILRFFYKNFYTKLIHIININSRSIFIIDLFSKNQKLFFVLKQKSTSDYKKIQIQRNLLQLSNNASYVDERDIKKISEYLNRSKKTKLDGICMGVRDNKEVYYFLKYLKKNSRVIGTDISPTIKKFKHGVMWNFNNYNKRWKNKFDFVYTNSIDHTTDPKKTFNIWLKYIKKGGFIFVDHNTSNGKRRQVKTDPCAIETELFPYLILDWLKEKAAIIDFIKPSGFRKESNRNKILIIKKFN
jgi:hypothetical protein